MRYHALCAAGITLLLSSTAIANPSDRKDSPWVHITNTNDNSDYFSAKRGSYEVVTTKQGTEVAMVLGQVEHKKKGTVEYVKWYVSTADCVSGIGKLVILKIGGDYISEADYVAKGENVASGIGDIICSIYLSDLEKKNGKGI